MRRFSNVALTFILGLVLTAGSLPVYAEPPKPAAEEPVIDESDEPLLTEEPAEEEPASEEPAVENTASEEPAAENTASEEPAEEKPASEDPAEEEPASEEPAVENTASEDPAVENTASMEPAEENSDRWKVTFSPVVNTTKTAITLTGAQALLEAGEADRVAVEAAMSYGGKTTRVISEKLAINELDSAGSAVLDFGDYGKWTVSVTFYKDGMEVHKETGLTAGIIADSYNIAPIAGTLPVTFFSLNLWGDKSIRNSGPTIIMIQRAACYNWDALPEGVYALPYMTREEARYQPSSASAQGALFLDHAVIVAEYVKDLLALNPASRFNFYLNDYYPELVQSMIYANGIPEDRYTITLMSDGSFTYVKLTAIYNDADPQTIHDNLVNEWNETKTYAYENGEVDERIQTLEAQKYLYALIDSEPNARLWVARKALIETTQDGNAFGMAVRNNPKVVEMSIKNLLTNNISDKHEEEFKALYDFNDSYFEEAKSTGKDAMMFLGSRVNQEPDFADYVKFVKLYYADDYVYYYKGHPATPTDLYPQKSEQLKELGLTDVDSSVAAELILFFNPEIYLSGYQSSTYASVPVGMGKGMFNMTKETGLGNPQYENMAFWMTPVGETTDERVIELCTEGQKSFLVEFCDTIIEDKGYDIGVWEPGIPEVRYYKEVEGKYELVGSSGGEEKEYAVKPGIYVISSAIDHNMVLDVAGGSPDIRANIQLYPYNATDAQKWNVSYDEDGLATITNVGSGRVIDAAGGKTEKKTNIQQYRDNGTAAQKWVLSKNSDGSILITSAKSDKAVIDVSGGKAVKKSNIQLYTPNGTAAQKWNFYSTEVTVSPDGQADLPDGWYTISSTVASDLVLQVQGCAVAEEGNLQIGTVSGKDNQLFYISRTENGLYRMQSAWSGLYVTLKKGSLIPGANVMQSSDESLNSEWAITQKTGGSYQIQNAASGTLLNVLGNQKTSGTNVNGWIANGAQGQYWRLNSAVSPEEKRDALVRENADALPDGVYTIYAGPAGSLVLDVKKASTDNRANIQIHKVNRTLAQTWLVSHDDKGYVTFTCLNSGKVIDIAGGTKASGTNVQQYRNNGTIAQKWIVIPMEEGTYQIMSAMSDCLVMDVKGGTLVNNSNLQVYRDNGTKAQRFRLKRLGQES